MQERARSESWTRRAPIHGHEQFPTAESELIPRIVAVDADAKRLAVEASSLSRWAARTIDAYVDEVLVCDPRENRLVSRNPHKSDVADAFNLCRLLRLGDLHRVYQATDDDRAIFKASAQRYIDLRKQHVALKQKIKATFRRWGVLNIEGSRLYSTTGRRAYFGRLAHPEIAQQLRSLYQVPDTALDTALDAQKQTKAQMLRLGRAYPEIAVFQEMPGVGPIGVHLFDALIQTPERFATKQKLWRYCQLGIRSQTSDGKPLGYEALGYEALDPSGRSELKAMSYRAWLAALRHADNEVATFFEQSLRRTGDRTHARLNTQRKILLTLWALWRHRCAYCPNRFLGSAYGLVGIEPCASTSRLTRRRSEGPE
jgi:transposase